MGVVSMMGGGGLCAAAMVVLMAAAAAPAPTTRPARVAAPSGPPEGIARVKIYDTTPGLVEGVDKDADPQDPTIDVYALPKGDAGPVAGVMVLPGGGYTNLSMANEGSSIARMFNGKGMAAFVVRYRHAPRYHNPLPQQDVERAIRYVRAHAAEYNVDPARLGVIGFSAGGHNAASLATATDWAGKTDGADAVEKESAKPDFAVLLYPVIDLTDEAVTHKGSRDAITNKDASLYEALSPQKHVTKDSPPMLIIQGGDDRVVPIQNSILMYQACKAAGVPAEIHIFEHGGHGFGLGGTDAALKVWPELMSAWLVKNKVMAGAAAAGGGMGK